jgi:hypothetical protein
VLWRRADLRKGVCVRGMKRCGEGFGGAILCEALVGLFVSVSVVWCGGGGGGVGGEARRVARGHGLCKVVQERFRRAWVWKGIKTL